MEMWMEAFLQDCKGGLISRGVAFDLEPSIIDTCKMVHSQHVPGVKFQVKCLVIDNTTAITQRIRSECLSESKR